MNNYIKNIVEDFDFDNVQNDPSSTETIVNTLREDFLDYVDMGLPSRTLWCKYNAGVDIKYVKQIIKSIKTNGMPPGTLSPYKFWYGNLCGWGETFPNVHALVNFEKGGLKDEFNWKDYTFTDSTDIDDENDNVFSYKLTKYCSKGFYGKDFNKDNLRTLEPTDDEATFDALKYNYPYSVKLPSIKDYVELLRHTNKRLVNDYNDVKGLNGLLLKSKINDAELFFPYSGIMVGPFYMEQFEAGHYWCTDLFVSEPTLAYSFDFGNFNHVLDKDYNETKHNNNGEAFNNEIGTILTHERYKGLAIRGILA